MRRRLFIALVGAECVTFPQGVRASLVSGPIYFAADLRGNRQYSGGADTVLPAASVIKLLIARTLVDDVAAGRLALDSRIPLNARDRVGGSDRYETSPPGAYPLEDLLSAMLSLSDNTASNALLQHLGMDRCNDRAGASGLRATRIRRRFYDWEAQRQGRENTTTPRESALLLVDLARRAQEVGRGGEVSRATMQALLAQSDRETIPAALPQRLAIANKTGELPGVRNDVAIVGYERRSPYVVSVMYRYGGTDRSSAIQEIRSLVRSLDRRLTG